MKEATSIDTAIAVCIDLLLISNLDCEGDKRASTPKSKFGSKLTNENAATQQCAGGMTWPQSPL